MRDAAPRIVRCICIKCVFFLGWEEEEEEEQEVGCGMEMGASVRLSVSLLYGGCECLRNVQNEIFFI